MQLCPGLRSESGPTGRIRKLSKSVTVKFSKPSYEALRLLKASFYIAIQDDCVRKNPFDFKLSEVLENDTKEKVALTEEQEQALLSFIKTMRVYHKVSPLQFLGTDYTDYTDYMDF